MRVSTLSLALFVLVNVVLGQHDQQVKQICQGVVAGMLGSSVGLVGGALSTGLSGGEPTITDGMQFFLAALGGGAVTGRLIDKTSPGYVDDDRRRMAREGMLYGCTTGMLVGMTIGTSSDVASEQSGMTISINSALNIFRPDDEAKKTVQENSKAFQSSADMLWLHSTIAGCIAGSTTSYLGREIIGICDFSRDQLDRGAAMLKKRMPKSIKQAMGKAVEKILKDYIRFSIRGHVAKSLETGEATLPEGITADIILRDIETVMANLHIEENTFIFQKGFRMPPSMIALQSMMPEGIDLTPKGLVLSDEIQAKMAGLLPQGVVLTSQGLEFVDADIQNEDVPIS